MKKLLVLLMVLSVGLGLGEGFAQKTKKKSRAKSKAKVEAPADITVAKNYAGFPNPLGHAYKAQQNGISVIVDFDSPYSMSMYSTIGKTRGEESWGWSQDGYVINAGNMYFQLSEDGKQLLEMENQVVLKIIR